MTRILGWFGIKYEPGCPCPNHARQMDAWGPDGCEENLETIIGWLREEAEKRTVKKTIATPGGAATVEVPMPFSEFAARRLVKLAIRRARKKQKRLAAQAGPS